MARKRVAEASPSPSLASTCSNISSLADGGRPTDADRHQAQRESEFLRRELATYTVPELTKEQEEERDLDLILWNVGIIKDYVDGVAKINEERKVDDTMRNISMKHAGSEIWTVEEQRLLESERQREDYFMMKKHLPGWVALEEDAPTTTIMVYRQRYLKALLQTYDYQYQASIERLRNGQERREELRSERETTLPKAGIQKASSASRTGSNRGVRTGRIARPATTKRDAQSKRAG